jgi:hypothetical protein
MKKILQTIEFAFHEVEYCRGLIAYFTPDIIGKNFVTKILNQCSLLSECRIDIFREIWSSEMEKNKNI